MKVLSCFTTNSLIVTLVLIHLSNGGLLKREAVDMDLFHEDGPLSSVYPDLGKEVAVSFLTNVRHKRDISAQSHHIIQLQIASSTSRPVTIHLSKNPMSFVIKDGSVERREEFDCMFTGVVSGGNGSAAFSACSATHALTGHLILEDEHYMLEPMEQKHKEDNVYGPENLHQVLHRVYRTADISAKENFTASTDSVKVSFEDMEKDVKSMRIPVDNKEDTDESLPIGNPLQGDDGEVNSVLVAKKQAKKAKGVNSNSKIVDMAVFLDPPLLTKWNQKHGKNGKAQLTRFVMNLVNNMNLMYQHSSLTTDVSLRLVLLEYLSETPLELHQTDSGSTYLSSFCKWSGDKNKDGRQWDHGLLLTGLDIKNSQGTGLAGIAKFSTICMRHLSCSVGEARSFHGSFVMTHEIGHSLGMNHDGTKEGTGTSISCDGSQYIMSTKTGAGKVTWSQCSSNNVKELLKNGITDPRTKRHISDHLNCLDTPSTLTTKSTHFKNLKSKLPGELYNADVQCHIDCGDHCSPYHKQKDTPEVCNLLRCQYKPDPKSSTINYVGYHPALEGTKCGTGKMCRHGQCVAQPKSGK